MMPDPRETARLAATHAILDDAVRILTPLVDGPAFDMATDVDIANALARLRLARDRMWQATSRALDVLERHELELDESRDAVRT